MKFKYLDTVYIRDNYLNFFSPNQLWVIKDYIREPSGQYRYCLYPQGVRKELGPKEDIWMSESNLETSMERSIRQRIEEEEVYAAESLDKYRPGIMSKKQYNFLEFLEQPVIEYADNIEEIKKEPVTIPEYSYEPIFKEDKE